MKNSVKVLHLFSVLFFALSLDYSTLEAALDKYEDNETDIIVTEMTDRDNEMRLKEKSCHSLIKAMLQNKDRAMAKVRRSISTEIIEERYNQIKNKCIATITNNQIHQIIDNNSTSLFIDFDLRKLIESSVDEDYDNNVRIEEEKKKVKQRKAQERWDIIKLHLIIIGFFSLASVAIILFVVVKHKYRASSQDINKKKN